MEFPNTWFEDRTKILWEKHVKNYQIESYLELGVCFGASMRWILENLKPKTAVGVDHWKDARGKDDAPYQEYKELCFENLAAWLQDGTLQLHEATSVEYLTNIIGENQACDTSPTKFDLIYIDGDHNGYEGMLDMMLAYQLLNRKTGEMELQTVDSKGRFHQKIPTGGIMIVDDLHRLWHFGRPLIGIAVHQFELLMHGRLQRLWKDGRQIAFVRID